MKRLYKINSDKDTHNSFQNADKFILKVILSQWLLVSTFGGWFYGTYLFGFISGGLISLIAYIGYKQHSGTAILRIINSIVLLTFSIILIQQNLGRIEMHFHIFVMLAFLVAYKDIKPMTIASAYIIIHHILFTYLQLEDISFFKYGYSYL